MSESSVKKYDVVVLGSGEGGKFVAWTLARQGKKVAVIERRYIGGSCPEYCLPSQQERDPQHQGGLLLLSQRGIRHQ